MIKVIAFDLGGVLITEKDIKMSLDEEKLERLFGPNISDDEYLRIAKNIVPNNIDIIKITINIINKLYEVREKDLLLNIKNKYPYIKIVIATNHVSYIREYINNNLDIKNIDEIYISAEINKIKPNKDFYEEIVNKMKCKPDEILFLDDNQNNVDGAKEYGLNAIKVDKNMNLFEKVSVTLEKELTYS